MHQKTNSPSGVGERLYNRNLNSFFCAFYSPVRTATLTAKWQGNPHQVPISPLGGPKLKKMTKTNAGNVSILEWPQEAARLQGSDEPSFGHAGSNLCLDFHGDPKRAGLVVFSDGNHHMALEECVSRFPDANPEAQDVFYATTPPAPLLAALEKGVLHVGNLSISASPPVFIGPGGVLDRLVEKKLMESHRAFAESRNHGFRSPI